MNLVFIRHGQSLWNLENKFTGWYDADLTDKGIEEAEKAGLLIKKLGIEFNYGFTSYQTRAIKTFDTILKTSGIKISNIIKAWQLNERHYGALQGLNKSQVAAEYGEEQVQIWRRSYDTPPPALNNDDERHPRFEIRYAGVSDLPASESLKDTLLRVKPYWQTKIIPSLLGNQDVLIVAHGNSLRAMVKMIENISDEEIVDFNIPTGIPLAYEFNENLKPIKQGFIGDPETIKQATQAVANQGLV